MSKGFQPSHHRDPPRTIDPCYILDATKEEEEEEKEEKDLLIWDLSLEHDWNACKPIAQIESNRAINNNRSGLGSFLCFLKNGPPQKNNPPIFGSSELSFSLQRCSIFIWGTGFSVVVVCPRVGLVCSGGGGGFRKNGWMGHRADGRAVLRQEMRGGGGGG